MTVTTLREALAERLHGEGLANRFLSAFPALGLPAEHADEIVELLLRRAVEATKAKQPGGQS